MKHFILEKESRNHEVIGVILSVVLLLIPFIFFYELFFDNQYWVNRIKLYRMFKKDEGELVYLSTKNIAGDKISIFEYTVDNVTYSIWLWYGDENSEKFTLDSGCNSIEGDDYIGLFITRFSVLRFGHKKVINKLKSKINEN